MGFKIIQVVSTCVVSEIKALISRQNHKTLSQQQAVQPTCNCRDKAECPLPGRCTIESVCYRADVTRLDTGAVETYTGVTKDSFKKRYSGHKSSFNNKKYEHSTTLSSYVWKLKNENVPYRVSWDILSRQSCSLQSCHQHLQVMPAGEISDHVQTRRCYPEPKLGVLYDMQT